MMLMVLLLLLLLWLLWLLTPLMLLSVLLLLRSTIIGIGVRRKVHRCHGETRKVPEMKQWKNEVDRSYQCLMVMTLTSRQGSG